MDILLTGATGYIGGATLKALVAAGHSVTAIVRSFEAAAKVDVHGDQATAVIGDLADTVWLTERLRAVDGAIHLATSDDASALDDAVLDAVTVAFAGTDKPYVHTGGVWVWGDSASISEDDPQSPPAITAWRAAREERLLSSGIRASLIAPAIVYGHGGGIPSMLVGAPRDASGALTLVGGGEQHWATVHVDDLADLYVLALAAPGGETYIGASGASPTVRELGEAIVGPEGSVVADTVEGTRGRFGDAFAEALLLDQQADGAKARTQLGWSPSRASLVDELAAGYGA